MTDVSHCQLHHLPVVWANHSLLTFELAASDVPTGSGAWRSDPALLLDKHFTDLFTVSVDTFLTQVVFEGLQIPLGGCLHVHTEPHNASPVPERQ
ncbi:hypothetical protein A0J61_10265 [Choanephora cucurbitarum]|uniref:Uncharacterized protein n=1 Tax=Choanephora cucurbitarum TaxID=101091 RepID=A0A1C7MZ44_9FUNG|nr:hypothetical protein A0J61_10265 [Choanephora cucurbitarum]